MVRAPIDRDHRRARPGSAPAEPNTAPSSPPITRRGAHETASQDPRLIGRVPISGRPALSPVSRQPTPTAISASDRLSIWQERALTEAEQLVCWARSFPDRWAILVGIYFQESDRHPRQVAGHDQRGHQLLPGRWEINTRWLDVVAKDRSLTDMWFLPEGPEGARIARIASWICGGGQEHFEEGIRQWTEEMGTHRDVSRLEPILYKSTWTRDPSFSPDWSVMACIKRMLPGEDREELLRRARSESPLFYVRCMADKDCG